jgi:hypothetical protein
VGITLAIPTPRTIAAAQAVGDRMAQNAITSHVKRVTESGT